MEDLSKYLPLYLGREIRCFSLSDREGWMDLVTYNFLIEFNDPDSEITGALLHLRSLSSMTEDEKLELYGMGFTCNKGMQILHPTEWNAFKPTQFQWLLSKGFDIFGLKEKGLALYPEDL